MYLGHRAATKDHAAQATIVSVRCILSQVRANLQQSWRICGGFNLNAIRTAGESCQRL
jgi:hypothetical protein